MNERRGRGGRAHAAGGSAVTPWRYVSTGGPAGPSTVSRKRAILLNAVECAVARGHLTCSPLTSITWRAPKLAEAVDPLVVIDHGQAGTLFAAVRQLRSAPPLVAFFAVMYYAALRPGEAVDLRKEALALPESG